MQDWIELELSESELIGDICQASETVNRFVQ